jgi:hypothetical protein
LVKGYEYKMVCISLLKSLYIDTPIIEGKRKKIKIVKAFNKPETPIGEFTILEEPVVAVTESKKPADAADRKKANNINTAI